MPCQHIAPIAIWSERRRKASTKIRLMSLDIVYLLIPWLSYKPVKLSVLITDINKVFEHLCVIFSQG